MANITECDGCGTRIGDGGTEPGMEGNTAGTCGLRPGVFHWCAGCAAIASRAVYASRPAGAQAEAEAIREAMTEAREHPGRTVTVRP